MSKKVILGFFLSLIIFSSASGQGQALERGLLVYDPNAFSCSCDVYSKLLPDPGYNYASLAISFTEFLLFQNKHVEIVGTLQECTGCEKIVVENIAEFDPGFVLGDPNGDGEISMGDVVHQINYLFRNGEKPYPIWTGDANLDDRVSISDAVFLINYLLRNGEAPGYFPVVPHQTPCKGFERTYGADSTEQIIIQVVDNDIIVTHENAFYNCCFHIEAEVTQNGYDIQLYEVTSGTYCYCLCYFDITTIIYDLSPGTYTISYYDADSQYVGGGEAVIPSNGRLTGSTQSGCLGTLFLYGKTYDSGPVYFQVNRDTLIMHHDNATYKSESLSYLI